ncbi:MAG TPA: LysR substrate-binding domain-containing protein, partial [Telluria sp.]|nr:LysR substrate-binding domain-containing protein [Telluria sp.]
LAPQGKLAFSSLDPLVEAACEGLGVVQAPDFAVRSLCAQGRLQPVLSRFEAAGPPVSLIYPHRLHLPAKVRAFGDFVAAMLA